MFLKFAFKTKNTMQMQMPLMQQPPFFQAPGLLQGCKTQTQLSIVMHC
jgi:hypothetical protein